MATAVKLLVSIEANSAKLVIEAEKSRKSLDNIKKSADNMKSSLSIIKLDALVNLGERAYHVATRIYNLSRTTATYGDEIVRMSQVLDMTTDKYQEFQYVAMRSDVSVQGLTMGMRNLVRSIDEAKKGSGEGADIFKSMGITIYNASGQVKTLDQIMGEIAGKFASWKEGPEKIAIALKLFGRSGEEMIPMLNKGSQGLKDLAAEFERLGIAISRENLERLSRADEIFEKFEARFKTLKTLVLTPVVDEVSKLIDKLLKLTELIERIAKGENIPEAISKTIGNREAWLKARQALGLMQPEEFEELERLRRPKISVRAEVEKVAPPSFIKEDFEEGIKYSKLMYEAWKEDYYGYYDELYTSQKKASEEREFWMEEETRWKKLQIDEETEIIREGIENAKDLYEFWLDERRIQIEAEGEEIQEGIERARDLHAAWLENYIANTADASNIGETLAKRFGDAWNFNIKNIITDSENMGDAIKKIFLGMGDAFTSAISRMISDWILFGSITGKYTEGAGIIGWLGGLLPFAEGGIIPGWKPVAMQEGGIIRRPTFGMIGEGGPEAVVPLKGGKIPVEMKGQGQGNTYIYISAVDAKSFDDMVRRNPESILKIIARDARAAGSMRTIIQNS